MDFVTRFWFAELRCYTDGIPTRDGRLTYGTWAVMGECDGEKKRRRQYVFWWRFSGLGQLVLRTTDGHWFSELTIPTGGRNNRVTERKTSRRQYVSKPNCSTVSAENIRSAAIKVKHKIGFVRFSFVSYYSGVWIALEIHMS